MPWGDVTGSHRAHRRWVAAVVVLAVLVGVLVAVLRSAAATATETAVVAVQPVAGRAATSPDDIAGAVVALAGTGPVLDAAAAGAGVTRDEARDDVDVTAGGAGIVTVTATGGSGEVATRLASATTEALAASLVRSNDAALQEALRPLQQQLQDLSVQLQAVPLGDPRRAAVEQNYGAVAGVIADRTAAPAPRLLPDGEPVLSTGHSPLAEALAAAAAVLVLGALAGFIARRRPVRRDPAPAMAHVEGPHAVLHPGDDAPAVLTRLYADAVRGRGPVLVLQLSDPAARDLGGDLVGAAEIVGDRVEHTDLTPGGRGTPAPPPASDGARRRGRASTVSISSLRRARVDGVAVGILRERQVRAALIAVDTRRALPARLADTVSTLEGLAVEVRGVVVWRGRLPLAEARPAPLALPPGAPATPEPGDDGARPTTPSSAVPSGRPSTS